MSTVIVSFRFLAPHQPQEELVRAHHALLCGLGGLSNHIALKRNSEQTYVLSFDEPSALRKYLTSDEYRRYSTQRGCYDVFVQDFEPILLPEDNLVEDIPPEALRPAALSA